MTNPNFPSTAPEPTVDLHAGPAASGDFGPNVCEPMDDTTSMLTIPEIGNEDRCNVGRTEQKFRIGAGAALLAAAAFAPVSRGWRIGFAVLGLAELITGTTRYCPVSRALGINTCRSDEA